MPQPPCYPVERWPRHRRPADWVPRPGDSLLLVRGGHYPLRTVTLLRVEVDPGKHLVAWDRFIARVPVDRLYPYPGWRERRAREDLEDAADAAEATGSDPGLDPVELPF